MANITATAARSAGFIPEVWANRAIEVLRANVVLAKLVMRDTDVAAQQVGDVLHIAYPGVFTAVEKSADTAIAPQVPSGGAEVQVSLNKHRHVTFVIEDAARATANPAIIDRYIEAAVPALAEAIESDLFALYANITTSVGTSGTALTPATVLAARKAMNDNKAPLANRHLVISTKDEAALLGDSGLASYFAYKGDGETPDMVGRLYGFNVWMSQLVPAVAGTPVSTKNLAFTPGAFILAMRGLPEPPAGSGAQAVTLRDPQTGLVLRVLFAYNPSHLGVQVTVDVLYGVKVLNDKEACVVLA